MSDANDAPQTLEGWYVLHDLWRVDQRRWRQAAEGQREAAGGQLAGALAAVAKEGAGAGDSAAYAVVGQKADLLFIHWRRSVDELKQAELALRGLAVADYLQPAGSYLSVIEAGLYEATAIAQKKLADAKLAPGTPAYQEAFDKEMEVQRKRLEARLRPVIPSARYSCFYPMSKRRGETRNWYDLPLEERRALMRGHGKVGHKYHDDVTQVVSGSIGLDDWEWAVTLFADDPLVFKKLVTEMRYDPASSRYAEFGSFVVGSRLQPGDLPRFLDGRMPER
ncbi:MAG: heme-dependent peroxidase [Paludibaculum sp.]